MKKNVLIAGAFLAAMFVMTSAGSADDGKKVELKCPVSGKVVTKKVSADYKGAEVYVCCAKCKKAVETNPTKFAAKANHQLALTKQAKCVKCVFAGKKTDPKTKIKVAGAELSFCCNGCKGKVLKEKDEAKQIEMVFNDKAFKKGFEIVKKDN